MARKNAPGKTHVTPSQDAALKSSFLFAEANTFRQYGPPDLLDALDPALIVSVEDFDAERDRELGIMKYKRGEDDRGAYIEYEFPQFLPADLDPEYLVVDAVLTARSFTYDTHLAWNAHGRANGLDKINERINDLRTEIYTKFRSSERESSIANRLQNNRSARTALLNKEKQPGYVWTDQDDTDLEAYDIRIETLNKKFEELQAARKGELPASALASSEALETAQRDYLEIYLSFAHKLATDAGATAQTLDEWKAAATGQDYRNAQAVIDSGNASLLAQSGAKALTPAQAKALKQQILTTTARPSLEKN